MAIIIAVAGTVEGHLDALGLQRPDFAMLVGKLPLGRAPQARAAQRRGILIEMEMMPGLDQTGHAAIVVHDRAIFEQEIITVNGHVEEGEVQAAIVEVPHDPKIGLDMAHQPLAADAPAAVPHADIAAQLDGLARDRDLPVEIAHLGEVRHWMAGNIEFVVKKRRGSGGEVDRSGKAIGIFAQREALPLHRFDDLDREGADIAVVTIRLIPLMRDMPGRAEIMLHAIADDAERAIDYPVTAGIGVSAKAGGDIGPAVLPVTSKPTAIHEVLAFVRHGIERITRLVNEVVVKLREHHHVTFPYYMTLSATGSGCRRYSRGLLFWAYSIACAMR